MKYIKDKYNYNIHDEVVKEWYNDKILTSEQIEEQIKEQNEKFKWNIINKNIFLINLLEDFLNIFLNVFFL